MEESRLVMSSRTVFHGMCVCYVDGREKRRDHNFLLLYLNFVCGEKLICKLRSKRECLHKVSLLAIP